MSAAKVTKEDVRAYLDRPWDEIARARERYWQEAHERDEDVTTRLAGGMWRVFRDLGYTTDDELRDADLAAHVHLKEVLERASRGRAR